MKLFSLNSNLCDSLYLNVMNGQTDRGTTCFSNTARDINGGENSSV